MVFSWKRTAQATMLGLGLLGAAANRADAALILSYEAAGVQASTVAGVTTEMFNPTGSGAIAAGRYASLNTAVGTISSPGASVLVANVYGGAGGSGNYFAVGAQSGTLSATLTLNGAESYFGFWWSAADRNNMVDFYSGGQLLGSLSTATAINALGSAFNGNPNSNQSGNTGEKYAYLNVTGTNGTTIDQVVFRNASLSTGFESDNFSIRSAPLPGPSGTVINGGIAVPEPSSLIMASIGGLMGAGTWFRTRRRTAAQA